MRSKTILCAVVIPLGCALTAVAQTQKPAQTPPKAAPADTTPAQARGTLMVERASKVIGGKVTNAAGEDLGKIEEVVINPTTGSIQYAVLSFGGIMGLGDKLFALPWTLIKPTNVPEGRKDYTFLLNVDKAKLEKAPGFPKNNWPDISTPTWSQEIDRFYEYTPSAEAAIDANRQFRIVKLSDLLGKDVKNASGEEFGEIKDIVLDPRGGRVSYFVLSSGGLLTKNKLFAIPWESLKVNRNENKAECVIAVPKEKFDKAPEFQDSEWAKMSDPVWVNQLYTYYGVRPYWSSTAEAGSDRPAAPPGGTKKDKDGR